jgi:hypothetical protein
VDSSLLEKFANLTVDVQWKKFRLSGLFFSLVKSWKESGLFKLHAQRFVFNILKTAEWPLLLHDNANSIMESLVLDMMQVILHLLQFIDEIEPMCEIRCKTFDLILGNIHYCKCADILSVSGYRTLISSLPRKWFGQIDSLDYNVALGEANPLQLSLSLLKLLAIQNSSNLSNGINDREIMYITYVVELISSQTNSEISSDALLVQNRSFNDASVSKIIFEMLSSCETMGISSLEYSCRKIISLLNHCSRESKMHLRLWEGITKSIKTTKFSLIYLKQCCNSIASVEEMALLAEECIDQYLSLTRNCYDWRVVQKVLVIPELEESTFIRNCLSHCLVYTLFANSLQRLASVRGGKEHEILIGEQIGVWIESLKVESFKDRKEGKVALLLGQFAHLLETELNDMSVPENHSRLRAHLPPMADAFFLWSSDSRGSKGIWAALGFGHQSGLSVEFKLFCRCIATFIVTRLLGSGPDSQIEREKMIDLVEILNNQNEFSVKYSEHITKVVLFLRDRNEGLSSLSKFVTMQTQRIFPEQLVFFHDQN